MRTSRTVRPLTSTLATPSTRCRRLLTCWSASSDSSRALRVGDSRARLTTGSWLSLLKRWMIGALASRGKAACTAATRSRTSCIARAMSASRLNSTLVPLRPSWLRDRMRRAPATLLTASSSGLVTVRSTASGEAPG